VSQTALAVRTGGGRCSIHGAVDGAGDSRGRLRCPVPTCRQILAIRDIGSERSPVTPVEVVSLGLSNDPDVRRLEKTLALTQLAGRIRAAAKPADFELQLSALREDVQAREQGEDSLWERCAELGSAIEELQKSVTALSRKLDATPTAGARIWHTCKGCGAKGLVAVNLECTSCRHQERWGWYPG
jgi:hypothetical protein